ncbi:MAG: TerD family protein [Bacteroidota bacterium]
MSSISLKRGESAALDGSVYDLTEVHIGLGWDVRDNGTSRPTGKLLGKLFRADRNSGYDLDIIAFLLDKKNTIANLGENRESKDGRVLPLVGSDVVHFNNLTHPSGTVVHTGDNTTGQGEGDDEQIVVKLTELPGEYERILFLACIYQGEQRGQHFGMVENAFIRALDRNGQEMVRYNLSDEPEYNQRRSMVFGEVYRRIGGTWRFKAIGEAYTSDSFVDIMRDYVFLE